MTDHPILHASEKNKDEALGKLLQLAEYAKGLPAYTLASEILREVDELADERIPVSKEAYFRMPHLNRLPNGLWDVFFVPPSHDSAQREQCRIAGGRCAFKEHKG